MKATMKAAVLRGVHDLRLEELPVPRRVLKNPLVSLQCLCVSAIYGTI